MSFISYITSCLLASTIAFTSCLLTSTVAFASNNQGKYYASLYGGLSYMNNKNFNTNNQNLSTKLSNGFTSGAAIGHYITDNISAELSWSYTTNDHNGTSSGLFASTEGNYASNIFGFTGYYNFNNFNKFKPYIGASMLLAQEIDMDFESGNAEQSFSTGGNIGYGLTLGSRYQITQRYAVFTDLQYNHFSSLDLKNENGTGKISNIKYNPIALRFGLAFNF